MKGRIDSIVEMAHSPIKNYVIPGLTSSLIGAPHKNGLVRLFECSRDHYESINPHSHRFDFHCLVLEGSVKNILWIEDKNSVNKYQKTKVGYVGEFGKYNTESGDICGFSCQERRYRCGEWYSMEHNEIHSIYFSQGAKVLFFEKAPVQDYSIVLEPVVDGKRIPTFKVEPWMFEKEEIK